MYIHGEFKDLNNNTIAVYLLSGNDKSKELVIGENGLYFQGDEPVTIEEDVSNDMDVLIRKSCSINLTTKGYVGDVLFSDNSRFIKVNVLKNDEVIFAGFVEPNTFSQPYVDVLDDFTINCTDALSTMQYFYYKNANVIDEDEFTAIRQTAEQVTFQQLLNNAFEEILDLDILNGTKSKIYYDLSKGVEKGKEKEIFNTLTMSELYIIGDDSDSVWTYQDVVEEMLKYLNLHIRQEGLDYYIFDLNSIRKGYTAWYDLIGETDATLAVNKIDILSGNNASDSANITIADVYNQISVKDDVESMEDVIVSPLDSSNLVSDYNGKQLFMREYLAKNIKKSANRGYLAFCNMLQGKSLTTEQSDLASMTDYFLQVMKNPNWKFYANKELNMTTEDLTRYSTKNINGRDVVVAVNQYVISHFIANHQTGAAIFNIGKVTHEESHKDNSIISQVDMTPYVYISLRGNGKDDETGATPTDETISANTGIIEYVGNTTGGIYSPIDDYTTNYLVFSGKIKYIPRVQESWSVKQSEDDKYGFNYYNLVTNTPYEQGTVPNSDSEVGEAFYTRKYYQVEYCRDEVDESKYYQNDGGIAPYESDDKNKLFQFNYSADWESDDLISKVPALECELIIGNKRCVEYDIQADGQGKFMWVDKDSGVTQTTIDDDGNTYTYLKQTFSLGFNPKIGDYVIGQEYDLFNNISYQMDIDATGTAIPIHRSDKLSGKVQFRILGPCQLVWNDITRKHPTFFKHTKWTDTSKYILAHSDYLAISDFNCKIYSDNAHTQLYDDRDLVYRSAEEQSFTNRLSDVEFKFITQLSANECAEKKVKAGIWMNAVGTTDNVPLSSIYDNSDNTSGTTYKPEELYVSAYYKEYVKPKIIYEVTLNDDKTNNGWRDLYHDSHLNTDFFVQSYSKDLGTGFTTLKLKQV